MFFSKRALRKHFCSGKFYEIVIKIKKEIPRANIQYYQNINA